MITVKEALSGKVTLDLECVDRVYLNGFVQYLQMPGGVVNFIREQKGWPYSFMWLHTPFYALEVS